MDLVEFIQDKRFLGQEFLTWLWFKSEERGGTVHLPNAGDITVIFEKHMLVEHGEGPASESVVCRGLETELAEAHTGLRRGKKVEQARIRVVRDNLEWSFSFRASLFEYRSLRPPRTVAPGEEAEDAASLEGRVLERVGVVEGLVRTMDELFRVFLQRRLSPAWEHEDLPRIRAWVHKEARPA
ncbi:MAG: hypothetical protein AB1634_18480, partial [Thermodesulfobacteriota bacterium]